MRRILTLAVVLTTGWLAGGCVLTLSGFEVPPQVWAGHSFEIVVRAVADSSPGDVGAVLQLPNGFVVDVAVCKYGDLSNLGPSTQTIAGLRRDDPSLLSIYTAEPGYYLASFSGQLVSTGSWSGGTLKVIVRSPANAGGAHAIKVSLAGQVSSGYQPSSPAGVSAFANITAAPYVRMVSVVVDPVSPFALVVDGLFDPSTAESSWFAPALADIDGDGNDDVYAQGYPHVGSWLSHPGAAWTARSLGLPSWPYNGLAFGDFDRDGFVDFIGATALGSRVLFNTGGTGWSPGPLLPVANAGGFTTVGDIDTDGIPDVVVASWSAQSGQRVQVFRSNGDRTFSERSNGLQAISASLPQILVGDLDGDGFCDLMLSGGYSQGSPNFAWTGDGTGNWTAIPSPPGFFYGAALGDIDNDGRVELLRSGFSSGLSVWRFQGNSWNQVPVSIPSYSPGFQILCFVLLDFDRDGWLDMAVDVRNSNRPNGSAMHLWRNLGSGSFAEVANSGLSGFASSDYGAGQLVVGDVDGDSLPDLMAAVPGEFPMVWYNTRSGLSPYGAPCTAAPFQTPQVTAIGSLQLGSSNFAYEVHGGQPNSLALLWLGVTKRYAFGLPLLPADLAPLGAPGCQMLAGPDVVFTLATDATGQATLPLAVPNLASFARLTVFAQGALLAPGANQLGWIFTAGLAAKIP